MRIFKNKYGAINPPKRLPMMYKSDAQFDYAVYRANLKNKNFTDEFVNYKDFKSYMTMYRDEVEESMGITGPSKLREEALKHAGYSTRFVTREEMAASNLYKEMQDMPGDFEKVNWDDIRYDSKLKGFVSNGYIITFNYGDEYGKYGLYKIVPLAIK